MKNTIPIINDYNNTYHHKLKIGDFLISENTITENYPLHQHDYFELEYITDGNGVHIVNGETFDVKKGDVLFITPFDYHGYKNSDLKTITCHFYAKDLSFDVSRFLSVLSADTIENASDDVKSNFKYLIKTFKQKDKFAELKLKNTLELILIDLFAQKLPNQKVTSYDKITEAIGYTNLNFRNSITLEQIEKKFGIAPSHFCREFKKRTGKNFVEYITEKRLLYAKRLLKGGSKAVDVCFESGFGSVRNFNRSFKKFFGITPCEFANLQNTSIKKQNMS